MSPNRNLIPSTTPIWTKLKIPATVRKRLRRRNQTTQNLQVVGNLYQNMSLILMYASETSTNQHHQRVGQAPSSSLTDECAEEALDGFGEFRNSVNAKRLLAESKEGRAVLPVNPRKRLLTIAQRTALKQAKKSSASTAVKRARKSSEQLFELDQDYESSSESDSDYSPSDDDDEEMVDDGVPTE